MSEDKKAKHPGGRPTDYKPEYAAIARKMTSMGATDGDLAEAFEVTTVTIWRWQSKHPEFCSALKIEKGEFDDRVERSLAQRAVGYSYDAVKIFMPQGANKPIYAPYRAHVPPDPGAAKIWLANRRGDVWRDRKEFTGADGKDLVPEASDRDLARAIIAILSTARLADQGDEAEEIENDNSNFSEQENGGAGDCGAPGAADFERSAAAPPTTPRRFNPERGELE